MNHKSTVLLLTAIGWMSFGARGQGASVRWLPPTVEVTIAPSLGSQYMCRGQRLGGASFQPVVEAAFGNFGFGVWSNFPVQNEVPGVSDPEIDPYGYYTINLSESLSVVPGFTVYTFPKADRGAGFYRSTFEP